MTPLVMIRHGPTVWNAAGRLQGRADPPLSEAGRVAVAGWRLPPGIGGAGWRWLSSPLARARATAALLSALVEAPAEVRLEPALTEMDWGAWEGRTLAALRAAGGAAMIVAEARGLDFRPPGGEGPRDVQARLAPLLSALATAGEPAVAVTHRGVIRALYAWARGWDMAGRPPERLREACAHEFHLDPTGRPTVARLNLALGP